jgi:hypothetical protein
VTTCDLHLNPAGELFMVSLFLSHSWEDKFFARKLAEVLAYKGVKVWIDEAELKVGDSLLQRISEAIGKTDFFGVILSHSSVSSSWVQKELQIAMNEEINGKKMKVLPILLEKCEMPVFLKDKLYADFTNPADFKNSLFQLLSAMGITERISRRNLSEIRLRKPARVTPIQTISVLEEFEDIRILGIDKEKVYNPDETKQLYNVFFSLSGTPPSDWVQIFEEERRFPRHGRWRHAWTEGRSLIVHCPLDEVKLHSEDLKQDVANSNQKYREHLHRLALQEEKERKRKGDERKKIDDAISGIDF